ncbi:polyprenol phosphomannose-dependent alpha 1,6 mannosyltransferase MptB [Kitasatospora sp. NPDC001540]|uniref:polyprenol phosphomannose-dependent alpha 1,6 mannosyltransferase MptB n=1 Tax=Kitasatospora sp. NPDC001540 TaxID=3364014 RepID=UPI00368E233E
MPNTGANAHPGRYRWLGLLGSLALATGGLTSGALPAATTGPALRASGGAGTVLVFAGLTVLTAAWLLLGATGRRPGGQLRPPTRWLTVTLAWWAAPLLLLPPLFSRDAYSYLAQGAMQASGFDVYADGPAVLGGPVAQQVPQVWQHAPAPYGPAFLLLARAAAPLADHPYAGTLLLRLTAVTAVAALTALLPALARRFGTDPAAALHLGALNPLVLLHLVAGAHNDAVPLALMLTGLLAATHPRPLAAATLIALAALAKAPAALALPAAWWLAATAPGTGELGFRRGGLSIGRDAVGVAADSAGRSAGVRPGGVLRPPAAPVGAAAVLVLPVVTALGAGELGFRRRGSIVGWDAVGSGGRSFGAGPGGVLSVLAAPVRSAAALALPAAWWLAATAPGVGEPGRRRGPFGGRWRPLLLAVSMLLAAAVTTVAVTAAAGTGYGWVSALTSPATDSSWSPTSSLGRLLADLADVAPEGPVTVVRLLGLAAAAVAVCLLAARVARGQGEPAAALALAFTALVALGPAFRPWYALWCVVPAAFAVRAVHARRTVELACAVLAFAVMPDGFPPDSAELVLTAGGMAAGAATFALAERQFIFQERQATC